jgi:hypothetical protein
VSGDITRNLGTSPTVGEVELLEEEDASGWWGRAR